MLALFAMPVLLVVLGAPDDQAEALTLIEHLVGRYYVDPDKPGNPVFSVALSKVGPDGEGLKCLKVFPELRELDLKDLEETPGGISGARSMQS
jgi:hypothetical protein